MGTSHPPRRENQPVTLWQAAKFEPCGTVTGRLAAHFCVLSRGAEPSGAGPMLSSQRIACTTNRKPRRPQKKVKRRPLEHTVLCDQQQQSSLAATAKDALEARLETRQGRRPCPYYTPLSRKTSSGALQLWEGAGAGADGCRQSERGGSSSRDCSSARPPLRPATTAARQSVRSAAQPGTKEPQGGSTSISRSSQFAFATGGRPEIMGGRGLLVALGRVGALSRANTANRKALPSLALSSQPSNQCTTGRSRTHLSTITRFAQQQRTPAAQLVRREEPSSAPYNVQPSRLVLAGTSACRRRVRQGLPNCPPPPLNTSPTSDS
ncbi:hypothetical protein K491DRAFT_108 [Lophiostoma macrostomum CBS 122681]|uniref:Uncharacterized protein n=1 Tax=Lophiostoma macrostomum CBS 122681 TaxID=1314788 RepID=A0A6A6TSC2_9PLEO|nr:hypothetical protein K491DRAFT_108 [Lophiostoma macrostomum CBS 122681]